MAQPQTQPKVRRIGLYGLILLALGMVSTVIWVLVTDGPSYDAGEVFGEIVYVDPEKRPHFVFPDEFRTPDLSLNRFVDRFFRICAEAKYSEFRLMLSQTTSERVSPDRFESMFHALKTAEVLNIKKMPDLPDLDGPVYVLTTQYELEDYASKGESNIRRLAIRKENEEWRLGPIPSDWLAKLRAYEQGTPIPAVSDAPSENEASPSGEMPQLNVSKAAANRPARIDP
ncbi:MAG: hypothetical protein MI923_13255 [Phycisphaerales bacterium]|nr:hypothetical protein [Phycisphaerales bacterium]